MKKTFYCISASLLIFLSGCATMRELAQAQQPNISLKNINLSEISFDNAKLMLDVEIENPNNFSVNLDGYNYDLALNKTPFVKGKFSEPQTINAGAKSNFKVPVEIKYKDLYDTFQSLVGKDKIDYDVLMGFDFNIPMLGKHTIPLKNKGSLPLPKIPKVKFDDMKLDNLSLSGADLNIKIIVENPNAFDITLNNFNYDLNVDGKEWAKSVSSDKINVPKKGENVLTIPVSIDFFTMGSAAYNAITSSKPLDYKLKGMMNIDTSLPIMKNVNVPLERAGKIKISK